MDTPRDLRVERGKQTRQQVLAAAFELLTEEGPNGFSAGKLARKAKISKSNLFHHFKQIDDIPFAVLEEMFGQFSDLTTGRKPKTITEFICMIGSDILDAGEERRKLMAAFVHFYLRSAHDEEFRAQQERTTRIFISHLQSAFEKILGRPLTSKERKTVPMLVAMGLEGMGMFSIIFKDRREFKGAWEAFSELAGNIFEKERGLS